jgi:hypothetical protein
MVEVEISGQLRRDEAVTERLEPARTAGPPTPVLVVVDADQQARMETEEALVRRFEPDFRLVTADSPTTGLAALEGLASDGEDVALIAAARHGRTGVPGAGP